MMRKIALLLAGIALQMSVAQAQDPSLAVRMSEMEEQMRQLYGQVEQLNMQILQLTEQMQQLRQGAAPRKSSEIPAVKPQTQGGELDALNLPPASGTEGAGANDDLYAYQTGELDQETQGGVVTGGLQQAPGPKPLGKLPGSGGGLEQGGGEPLTLNNPPADPGQPVVPEQVETASLEEQAPVADTPEKLYELSYESLLRRRYGEAEAGFRSFVQKHPEHDLAGNAEYWLGETYYLQSNYKAAAQAFLTGYQTYPKNRKAADSLLKLGLSLNHLGQKDQACAAFATIEAKYPKAAEARKRAQNESEKVGC
jgi:tol-pal system protein YbgF